ncbi:MAG: protein kinase domain-containing protein [Isosphaeraceae bacterium]
MNDPSPLEAIFFAALEKGTPQERAAYLDEACAGDPELRRRIQKMLAAQDQAGSFLEKPAKSAVMTVDYPITEGPGSVIGPYKLLEQIGEGGFGVVFVAEQMQPVRRKVALKILKPGMDSRPIVARFEAERQALAIMDHPNIARVLDAGTTPPSPPYQGGAVGRPYFVMELVKGMPITEFCDQNQLTPRQRLELFVPVCQAVQHAHQKGIIHRDLKPSNVLVSRHDTTPAVKVIDFGVAKALGQELTDKTLFTGVAQMIGTPLYMSPEQAGMSDLDIDTRSDIYSLGVLLYELLTGTTPFTRERFQQATYEEIRRIIREEEPPRPSTRLRKDEGGGRRDESKTTIRSSWRRYLPLSSFIPHPSSLQELDWIVMKAMEKDRNRRYETASGFARDIERYLHDEPVEARPPSAGYRLRKFVKRHKAPAIAAGLVLMALLIGVTGTTFGLIRAEVQRKNAERAQKAETKERKRAESERDKAVAAEAKTRTINEFLTQDLLTQAEPANNAVEDHVELLEVLDRAAANVGQRFAGQPELESALRATIAQTYHGLASWAKAEAQWRSLLEAARQRDPRSAEPYQALSELAHILRHRGRRDADVMTMAETAADGLGRTLGPDHADTLNALANLALAYLDAGKLREGTALLERVRDAKIAQLGPDHPDTLRTLNNLAGAYWSAKQLDKSVPLYEDVLKRREAKLGRQHPDTQVTVANLGVIYKDSGRLNAAIPLLEEAHHASIKLPNLRWVRAPLLDVYAKAGRSAEAVKLVQELLADARKISPKDSPQLAGALAQSGLTLLQVKAYKEAEPILRECLAIREKTQADLWSTFNAKSLLGGALMGQEKYAEAEPLLRRGYEGMKQREAKIPPQARDRLTDALERLVRLYEATSRPDEAARWRKEREANQKGEKPASKKP